MTDLVLEKKENPMHDRTRTSTLALVLILGLGIALAVTSVVTAQGGTTPSSPAATTYRVAKTGDGADGLTWATAFTDLQDALALAVNGDEIWVATGVYTPGALQADTFQLVSGVGLYGGFAGGETLRAQRDWEANVTVLSGDIGGDDGTDANGVVTNPGDINGANSRTVVSGSSLAASTRLDGFTITAGDGLSQGGGLYNSAGSPALENLFFSGNRATWNGGALHNTGASSSPVLTHVRFANNGTTGGDGGAIFDNSGATLTLVNATFTENHAAGGAGGGAILSFGGTLHVVGSTFLANTTGGDGGAIHSYGCVLTVENSTFSGNQATGSVSWGGAISHRIPDGSSSQGGARLASDLSSIANSTFTDNEATQDGGAININGLAVLTLANCTFSHNEAGGNGDSVYNGNVLHLINSILANTDAGVDCYNASGDTIATNTNNLIETNGPAGHKCGTPALTADPKLGPLVDNGGATKTFALISGSPALDAGNDAACAATPVNNLDQRGVARPQGSHCDIGAYEAVQTVRCYVHNDDTSANYSSFDAVALQTAVDEAAAGDLLKVAGICQGVEWTAGQWHTVYISKSLTLQGGYTHTNWLATPDLDTYATTLDANAGGRVAYVSSTLGITLSHLILTGGKTPDQIAGGQGGGIYSQGALSLDHSLVISNATGAELPTSGDGGDGAGIYSLGSLNVTYSTVSGNTAGHGSTGGHGGGIYVSGTLTLDHSTVSDNRAGAGGSGTWGGHGGGLYIKGTATLSHSTISGNTTGGSEQSIGSAGDGGGIYNEGALAINNCTLSGNNTGECSGETECNSGGRGGGTYSVSQVTISHSTVTGNTIGAGYSTPGDGGGIYNDGGSVSLQNTILAGNTDAGGETLDCGGDGLTSLDYNLVKDTTGCTIAGATGHNVVGQDPLLSLLADNGGPAAPLAGQPTWTHALRPGSPALDHIPAGTNGCGTTFSDDQRDVPRPQPALGHCDIGAVEMEPSLLAVILSGSGSGTVSSSPAGILCTGEDGADCSEIYAFGAQVTLSAAANTGSTFTGWSGEGCSGAGTCQVLMDRARSVTASFALNQVDLSVTVAGEGRGQVTSQPAGLTCTTGACQAAFDYGTVVTLSATADTGSVFDGWSGDCTNDTGDCVVTMEAARSVTATFGLGNHRVYLPFVSKNY